MVDAHLFEFSDNVVVKIHHSNPAVFYVVEPLFVVAVVRMMEIQDIFSD